MPGRLFVVATPIGNLGALSPRAVELIPDAFEAELQRRILRQEALDARSPLRRRHAHRQPGRSLSAGARADPHAFEAERRILRQEALDAGRLFVVATPIGNLGALSPRAVELIPDEAEL